VPARRWHGPQPLLNFSLTSEEILIRMTEVHATDIVKGMTEADASDIVKPATNCRGS